MPFETEAIKRLDRGLLSHDLFFVIIKCILLARADVHVPARLICPTGGGGGGGGGGGDSNDGWHWRHVHVIRSFLARLGRRVEGRLAVVGGRSAVYAGFYKPCPTRVLPAASFFLWF